MKYFKPEDTLLQIAESFPETVPVFVSNGFPQMDHKEQRSRFAGTISLRNALLLKQLDLDIFVTLLEEAIDQKRKAGVDATLQSQEKILDQETLNIVGLLPCPVRLPLLEEFNAFNEEYKRAGGIHINHELKAASMGLEWVEENIDGIENAENLPDLFLSAGFDMFFDEKKIGKFKKLGVFEDTTGLSRFNSEFEKIQLKDPAGHYGMIGVVPAVFLINLDELGDCKKPVSWSDILKPEFERRVSLPVGDFDLFNGILLNIHKHYGDEGVRKLGRSLMESMHPSQMVKSHTRKEEKPIVTIMPYFFTKMVREGSGMAAVWPEDGAIISPIFMLSKKDKLEKLQPVIDFFASREVGEVLSHKGLFPSVHPSVDNHIDKEKKYMWLGWDYIYSHDIADLIRHCEKTFHQEVA